MILLIWAWLSSCPDVLCSTVGYVGGLEMTRRVDAKTAELVEIALLTRAAFEKERALRYASIAGLPPEVADRIFSRPENALRSVHHTGCVDRRKSSR